MNTLQKLSLVAFASALFVGCVSKKNVEKTEPTTVIEKTEATEKYEPNWESLAKHQKEPEWFKDSKLGIYFHWGPYSVPAVGSEWYPYFMYRTIFKKAGTRGAIIREDYLKNWGTDFNYHDFIPLFKGEHFDAKEWAELFANSGAKFAGPVAQHHDGFAMWDSDVNPWNSKDMGPEKDILGDLFAELKKRDLKTIATFHHARTLQRYATDTLNWQGYDSHFAYGDTLITSTNDDKLKWLYGNVPAPKYHEYWLDILKEVIGEYNPDIIWFDTWLDRIPDEYLKKMVAEQYNAGEETVVTFKHEDLPRNLAVLDIEQGGMKEMPEDYWMTDITLSYSSWSYVTGQEYKPLDMVLRNMVDVWSKRGIVLLNVSPTAAGVICDEQRAVLKGMGEWLSEFGEAVYGTRSHEIFGYGAATIEDGNHGGQKATIVYDTNDIRFTKSKDGNTLYAFLLGEAAANTEYTIKHVYNGDKKIKNVSVLGAKSKIEWSLDGQELTVKTPSSVKEIDHIATIVKIEF